MGQKSEYSLTGSGSIAAGAVCDTDRYRGARPGLVALVAGVTCGLLALEIQIKHASGSEHSQAKWILVATTGELWHRTRADGFANVRLPNTQLSSRHVPSKGVDTKNVKNFPHFHDAMQTRS